MRRIDPKTGLKDSEYVIQLFPRDYTYQALRGRLHDYPAKSAWYTHKVMKAFFELEKAGRARLVKVVDEVFDFDDLMGDMYDPEVNSGIDGGARMLKAAYKRELERANNEGIWGIRAEVFAEGKWIEVEACWGYIGDDVEDGATEYASCCVRACKTEDERLAYVGFENEEACACH